MLKLLLLLALVLGLSQGYRHHRRHRRDLKTLINKIPECKAVHGEDAGDFLANCNAEVNQCFSNTHKKAMACLMEEIAHWAKKPGAEVCREQTKAQGNAWLKSVCKTQLSVKKCMAGEAATAEFEFPAGHHEHGAAPHSHTKHLKKQCWAAVKQEYKDCRQKGMEQCDNLGACVGKESAGDDARLQKWHEIAHHNKHEMGRKIKAAKEAFEACLEEQTGTW